MSYQEVFTVAATSPAAPGTSVSATTAGLLRFDEVTIEASLIGATGGTLDIYVQRQIAANLWADIARFPQLAAGAAAVKYGVVQGTLFKIGIGTDAAPAPAFDATAIAAPPGASKAAHPGDAIRFVMVAGAATTAGAALTFYVRGARASIS